MPPVTNQNTDSGLGNRRHLIFGLMRHGTLVLAWLVFSGAQSAVAQVALIGDVNLDGFLDSVDANLLTAEIAAGTNAPFLDVNNDSLVNLVDLDVFFLSYSSENGVPLAIALVDVNFDTVNTVSDFQLLQSNLGIATTDFTAGNLNADSLVDSADLNLYLSRGGVVPEPSTFGLAVVALLGLLAHGHRRRRA